MLIRPESVADEPAGREVLVAAFPSPAEADLVERLRRCTNPLLALVAEIGQQIVGHILFTPVTLAGHSGLLLGLAPLAVLPEHQNRGIGTALTRSGLTACRSLQADAVFVLGHEHYYPRFGFQPAGNFGIDCEYDVDPSHFMLLELVPASLSGRTGTARYHPEFNL